MREMHLFNNNHVTAFLILSLFGSLISLSAAAPNYNDIYCPNNATYKSNNNTTFQTNLNVLLSSLVTNATHTDSYSTAMGFGSTTAVNGVFLCPDDVSSAACEECVATAATEVTRLCPNKTESIIWYDECMLRYTNRYFGPTSTVPRANVKDDKNISIISTTSDLESFNEMLLTFLDDLAEEAAGSQTAKKFATGERNFTGNSSRQIVTLYGLAQCVPGVTNAQCEECLVNASRTLPSCCEGKQGARVLLACQSPDMLPCLVGT